jgi:hypothetical protein
MEIKIISKYDDNSSLDYLATECNYEVIISKDENGSINSALCDGDKPGEQVLDVVDNYKLLKNEYSLFPTMDLMINRFVVPLVSALGK